MSYTAAVPDPPPQIMCQHYLSRSPHFYPNINLLTSSPQYIISRLEQLDCSRWNITTHEFEDSTPLGTKPFINIIATMDSHLDKRLVLAAHYDSKILKPSSSGKQFLGATDSALPVALLLDMALTLDSKLKDRMVSRGCLCIVLGRAWSQIIGNWLTSNCHQ